MMLVVTHKAIERMIAVGNTKENAEVIVEIINSKDDNLATKGDIVRLESNIERLDMKIDSVKTEVGTTKWMIGLLFALNVTIIGLVLSIKISIG